MSRTVGESQLVDEMIFSFTHIQEMPWIEGHRSIVRRWARCDLCCIPLALLIADVMVGVSTVFVHSDIQLPEPAAHRAMDDFPSVSRDPYSI